MSGHSCCRTCCKTLLGSPTTFLLGNKVQFKVEFFPYKYLRRYPETKIFVSSISFCSYLDQNYAGITTRYRPALPSRRSEIYGSMFYLRLQVYLARCSQDLYMIMFFLRSRNSRLSSSRSDQETKDTKVLDLGQQVFASDFADQEQVISKINCRFDRLKSSKQV